MQLTVHRARSPSARLFDNRAEHLTARPAPGGVIPAADRPTGGDDLHFERVAAKEALWKVSTSG